jgi:hypothetical protein
MERGDVYESLLVGLPAPDLVMFVHLRFAKDFGDAIWSVHTVLRCPERTDDPLSVYAGELDE